MSEERARRLHGERGATLILAIGFMLVIGAIGSAVMSSVVSGVNNRRTLDSVRDKEYAADGGVEYAIAQVRAIPLPGGPGLISCGPNSFYSRTGLNALNGINIRIDCANQPTITPSGYLQRNVIFTACVDTGAKCGTSSASYAIVRAQVNFQAQSAGSRLSVTRTWVQSWSVNR